nr:reverse transcriptase domain-containing protein [Tanacetum cinerariifolium]
TKSGGLLAGIHGLFSGRYYGLIKRVTCGYPWPRPGETTRTLKFRWRTVFATGRRSFIELGMGLGIKRTNRRTRVPISLYPCHIEEKMTIKEIVTQVTVNVNNANGGNGNGGNNRCSYKTFIACNRKEFDGKGGALALTHWIEKMESMFDNSGCTANQRARGCEAAIGKSWNDFKALLVEEFCPSNEMEKLENEFWNHTMVAANHVAYTGRLHELAKLVPNLVTPKSLRIESAILTVGILTDEAVRCGTLTKGNDKRKEIEESSKQGSTCKDNKKSNTGSGFMAIVPPRNDNVCTYPKCAKCYTFHPENPP